LLFAISLEEKQMKNIFRLLFVAFCLLPSMNPLHAQWIEFSYLYSVNTFAASGTNLFAGITGVGVFRFTNNDTNWTAVNSGLTNKYIYALAVSGTNLFAGTGNGVFLSTNNGTSWNVVNNGLPNADVHTLTVSGTNLYAGIDSSGVFLSTNNGTSWTAANTILKNAYVNALAVSGTNLFAVAHSKWTTLGGVFLSTDNGTSWNAVNNGLTNTSVNVLTVSGTNLFAGTAGGGVFLSTDNGTSWTAVYSKSISYGVIINVYALTVSGTNLFESGSSYYIYYTKLKWFSPVKSVTQTSPMNASVTDSLSPLLVWNADSNAATYHLQVSRDSIFTSVALDSSVLTTNLQYPGKLVSNTIYYWRVNASNYVGTSTWSSIWHFTTNVLPPSNDSAHAGNSKITLTWRASASPNINKYKIYRGTSSPASTIHDSTTTTSYIDTGLTNGTQYFYRITTENIQYLEGTFSSEVSATPFNMHPYAASLYNMYEPNAGSVLLESLNFSSTGSYDPDGTVDSIFWFINGNLVGRQQQLTYKFAQGTNQVKLVVQDNQGARDSSNATVNRSMFKVFLNGPVYAGPSLLGSGVLYVIGTGDVVYRMDSVGNVLYSLSIGGNVTSSSSIAFDTTVYIASSDKNLYAFSKYGNEVWPVLAMGGVPSSTPAVDSITNRLYIGVSNKNFIAVNRSTGIVSWNYFADAPIASSAVITSDRKLVVATVKGTIYGFELTNPAIPLTPAWQLALSDSIYSSPAVDNSGYIYYCTTSGKVFKIYMPQTQQPSIVWQAQTGGRITGSPVIDGNGNLYVGCIDSKLYAINAQNGGIKWTYQSSSPILSTPAISEVGSIYFGNHGGKVIAIDSSSNMHWYYQDSTSIDAPLLYERGTLYVGTVGAKLLAFYDGADSSVYRTVSKYAGLANTNALIKSPIWGTFQGNNQRTGVVSNGIAITGVKDKINQLPTEYSFSQNYPNPFNPSTTIQYGLPSRSTVRLVIYNVLGQVVKELINTEQQAGYQSVVWNANVSSGLYFYRLEAVSTENPSKRFVETKKMLLLK
jgi:outer membrane protein assembly factor BamB